MFVSQVFGEWYDCVYLLLRFDSPLQIQREVLDVLNFQQFPKIKSILLLR